MLGNSSPQGSYVSITSTKTERGGDTAKDMPLLACLPGTSRESSPQMSPDARELGGGGQGKGELTART